MLGKRYVLLPWINQGVGYIQKKFGQEVELALTSEKFSSNLADSGQ